MTSRSGALPPIDVLALKSTSAESLFFIFSPRSCVGSGDPASLSLDAKTRDRIFFGKGSGAEVKIDGEDLLIMKESDILGVAG
ncbi:hypothetical protein RZS28_04240 [Methylocapsa polymorpha]|uniref:10 kDa chaperonin n=1 Tax=Methylocapsa polymorpha TaxID=3080828 RepID=A0ABZ0HUX1_9HYPH|nr:hypothetical protein RZS28_04240 [Methylocapsa sp. RX1]